MKAPHEPATMQDLYQAEARLSAMIIQVAEVQTRSVESAAAVEDRLNRLTGTVETLSSTVSQLSVSLERVGERVDKLAIHAEETSAKLDALISIVDDIIRRPQ